MNSPACRACGSLRTRLRGTRRGRTRPTEFSFHDCADCGLLFVEPFAGFELYDDAYYRGQGPDPFVDYETEYRDWRATDRRLELADLHRLAAEHLRGDAGPGPVRWLDFGCGAGALLKYLRDQGTIGGRPIELAGHDVGSYANLLRDRDGFRILGLEQLATEAPGTYDIVSMIEVIEHLPAPLAPIHAIARLLRPGGLLLLTTGNLDCPVAHRQGLDFSYCVPEIHVSLFNPAALGRLYRTAGLEPKNLRYRDAVRFKVLKNLRFRPGLRFAARALLALPPVVRLIDGLYGVSAMPCAVKPAAPPLISMRPAPFPPLPGGVLSVIVPVYNEAATVRAALDAILAKEIPGWRLEIILVESNSTDGTRDAVLARRDHPRVRLILEDQPRGKGHAVRAGLEAATGDVVLIQDADLEYDLGDYEILLAPLAAGRQSFVLGSRHGEGGWAIRSFSDQPLQALLLNAAHWGFTLLINVSLGVWLRDPFTMYKVFRRDCLAGLRFECNRFDFDWELLIKLIRSGHRPIEIPVSYRSRSFKQGKKIAMVRDPLTWLWALARFRFARL